jgi:lipoyl(octanoyl) transferase
MSSEVETYRDISEFERSQRFLDFARNDRRDATLCLFSSLHVYLDNSAHSAAMNMAIDEALLEQTVVPSIRFYRWQSPALSFGYFGKFSDIASYTGKRDLVRRWTGGGIVFHGDDLTYSIVIPVNDSAFGESSISIYEKIHRALADVLNGIGEGAELAGSARFADRTPQRGVPTNNCFANPVHADVMINGRKVAGAAQRRTRRGLLQQGSIQGVHLDSGLAERFAEALSANRHARKINEENLSRARELAQRKYGTDAWLHRR